MSLRPHAALLETSTRVLEFQMLARCIAAMEHAKVGHEGRARFAQRFGCSPRVVEIVKSAVAAGGAGDAATWGTQLMDFRTIADAWLESLRSVSIFDAVRLGGMRPAPLRTRLIVVSGGADATGVSEFSMKPVSSLSLTGETITERKSIGMLVATSELFKFGTPDAVRLFDAELRRAVVAATDSTFISELYAGVSPTASLGNSPSGPMNDIEALLAAVDIAPGSRVYFIIDPTNAKKLACMTTADGLRVFPNFGLNGGELVPGLVGLISDQLPSGAALLIVADGLLGTSEEMVLRSSNQTTVQMETAPHSPQTTSTVYESLWQRDMRAMIVERYFGFAVGRDNSVAALSGVNY